MPLVLLSEQLIDSSKGSYFPIIRSLTDGSQADAPRWVGVMNFTHRLRFCKKQVGGALNASYVGVALDLDDQIVVGCRATVGIASGTLLFSGVGYVIGQDDNGYYYEATLNLDTVPTRAALALAPGGQVQCTLDVHIVGPGAEDPPRFVYQFPIIVHAPAYRANESDPASASPLYPGPQGPSGLSILNGTVPPISTLGRDGEFYLDLAAVTLYGPKVGGAWPESSVSLVGSGGGGNKVVTVADDTARFALTPAQVKNLDWVRVSEITNGERAVWGVVDNTKLLTAEGWVHLGYYILFPANTVAPSIPATLYENVAATCNPGSWTDSPTGYSYQWQSSSDNATWTGKEGQTSNSYTPTAEDIGAYFRCLVSATNTAGTSVLVASASGQVFESSLPSGLVAEYLFQPGAELADTSGNGFDLTNTNNISIAGGVATFDGGDGYLVNPNINLVGSSGFAFFARLRFSSLSAASGIFIGLCGEPGGTFMFWTYEDALYAALDSDVSGHIGLLAATRPAMDTWFSFIVQYDGAALSIQIDSNPKESVPMEGLLVDPSASPSVFELGGANLVGGCNPFDVSRLRMWNRALTDTELSILRGGY